MDKPLSPLHHPTLYSAVLPAISDAIDYFRGREELNAYIPRIIEYPEITEHAGFPFYVRATGILGDTPTNYSALLNQSDVRDWNSWKRVYALFREDDALKRRFKLDVDPAPYTHKQLDDYVDSTLYLGLSEMAERYAHLHGVQDFREAQFRPIYGEWETATFASHVGFDIIVPLLGVPLPLSSPRVINESVGLEPLSSDLQHARMAHRSMFLDSDMDRASVKATHGLVLYGWYAENTDWINRAGILTNAANFKEPLRRIDQFYAALRIATRRSTGYGQVVLRHRGWADRWRAKLPPVHVFTVRQYPAAFDHHSWAPDPAPVSPAELDDTCSLFSALHDSKAKGLRVASRRLNAASLRSDEADSALDLTIGLESLLTPDSRTEITYKLSLRLAALAKCFPLDGYSPVEVFEATKKLYDFRSAVAHGAEKADRKRQISVREDHTIPAVEMGTVLLGFAMRIFALHPEIKKPDSIDRWMLGAPFDD